MYPAWYFTLPELSWDAMLKLTDINFELLADYDVIPMFEKAKRGGLSQCNKKYAKADNKYMKNFNPNNPSSYLLDLNANNLYGLACLNINHIGDLNGQKQIMIQS